MCRTIEVAQRPAVSQVYLCDDTMFSSFSFFAFRSSFSCSTFVSVSAFSRLRNHASFLGEE